MKFFSELGSCFYGGGATVTPAAAAETSQRNEKGDINYGSRSSPEVAATTVEKLRKMKSANSSKNWKPKLHVISETSVVMAHDSSPAVGSGDKLSVKVKAKSKPKVPSYTHGDDFWKSSGLWALPVFSPAPFSF